MQRIRSVLSAIGVLALAVSPFLIYLAFQELRPNGSTELVTEPGPTTGFLSPSPELSLSPTPSPAPSPVDPASVTVEVRNAGSAAGAAAETAERLREAGFVVTDVSDHQGDPVTGFAVLFRQEKPKGDAVSDLLHTGPSEPFTQGISSEADVVVLVGQS
jgi:hypothetical protein